MVARGGIVFPAIASTTPAAVETLSATGLDVTAFTDPIADGETFPYPEILQASEVQSIMGTAMDQVVGGDADASSLTAVNERVKRGLRLTATPRPTTRPAPDPEVHPRVLDRLHRRRPVRRLVHRALQAPPRRLRHLRHRRAARAAQALVAEQGLAGTFGSFEEVLASDVDAVAIFTQRWTHGPLVVAALRAGKHVYSAVPMAITERRSRHRRGRPGDRPDLHDGGDHHYNPATVYARSHVEKGTFGRVFYAEGDYVHDMDLGFYDAYRYSAARGGGPRPPTRPCSTRPTPWAGCSGPSTPTPRTWSR